MPRKKREEQEFGSDSFLDVVANIVGILIVLVVCAGVRAERGPSAQVVAEMTEKVLDHERPVEAVSVVTPVPVPEPAAVWVSPPLPDLPELPPIPEVTPPRTLVDTSEQLRQQNEELARRILQLETRTRELAPATSPSTDLEQMKTAIAARVQSLRGARQQMQKLEAATQSRQSELTSLRRTQEHLQHEPGPVLKLTHRLPPIGRVVNGNEIHFRLQNNRVSYVPVKQLAEDVQRDIERRKELLLNRPSFQGTTSPVGGYVMEYVLQRMNLSLQDELRHGRGMIRIGVSGWVIRPEHGLVTESAEEALSSGSRFVKALQAEASPTSTVTFWVYPDSFEIHRTLKDAIHAEGLWVASRPLPTGVPISGSPEGSKSLAQ